MRPRFAHPPVSDRAKAAPVERPVASEPGLDPRAATVLDLQRGAGNAAVARLLQRQAVAAPAEPLEDFELTVPELAGIPRLEQAKLNNPVLKRQKNPSGPAVYAIQKALIKVGRRMPKSTKKNAAPPASESPGDPEFTDRTKDPDGIWGDETTSAIADFQRSHGLAPDARVGNKTLKALQEAVPRGPVPITPSTQKTAEVESFSVRYDRDDVQDGKVKIDVDAVFKDDANHDPDQAEFQQFVSSHIGIRRPDGSLQEIVSRREVHDDEYHRDPARINTRKQTYSGNTYKMTDRAGLQPLDDNDNIEFRFTAEQLIVDLSRGGLIVARRGPHTVIVTGRHPRKYHGAPKEL